MRLFIATPLTKEIEESLAKVIFILKQKRGNVKWVAPKNIHLTLKFLGEVEENKVSSISAAIGKVAEKHASVRSVIDGIGAFPNPRRPRVIWAGLSENIDLLRSIASDIEDEMEKLGFEKEKRPFKSHLTLGRVRKDTGLGELAGAIESFDMTPEEMIFDRIVLFKSTLTPGGPIYGRLFEAKLSG